MIPAPFGSSSAKILRDLGLEVIEGSQWREGLERLSGNPEVELVLVDWNMPEMDGLDFIRAGAFKSRTRRVRIMMVTSEAEQEQVLRALEAGANEYLMKPFSKEVLFAKLSLLDIETPPV